MGGRLGVVLAAGSGRLDVRGDRGSARYLAEHSCRFVEPGDVAEGRDFDTPESLRRASGNKPIHWRE